MQSAGGSGWTNGIPDDDSERKKIRKGLKDDEKQQFDDLIEKIKQNRKFNKDDHKFVRKLKAQKKIKTPSKRFSSASDGKIHQDS